MKKVFLNLMIAGTVLFLFSCAKTTFQSQWRTKFDHDIISLADCSPNMDRIVGSSPKQVSLLDASSGQIKWSKKYKEMTEKMKKTDEHFAMWEANALFVFDRKLGADQMAVFDINNGNLLWSSDKYQNVSADNLIYFPELDCFAISLKESLVLINAKTGEEKWETKKFRGSVAKYIYLKDKNQMVMINFKPSGLAALFTGFKNQLVSINVTNGDVMWEATYRGAIEKKVVTREPVINLSIQNNKVFLMLNGLQVYDLNNGQNLWSAAFDETPNVVPKPLGAMAFGAYDVVAEPLVIGSDVYVVDFKNKGNQFIKKYDINTGEVKWTSPELKNTRIVPRIYMLEGKLVLQIGGLAERQYTKQVRKSCGQNCYYYETVYIVDYKYVGPFGVLALDANSGQQLWRSEKFDKRITNMLSDGKMVYVASGTDLYGLNPSDGNPKFSIPLKNDKVGKPFFLYSAGENVVIACDKGVSSHKMSEGSLNWATLFKTGTILTKRSEYSKRYGDVLVLKNVKGTLGAFDINKGTYLGQAVVAGSSYTMASDGSFLFQYFKKYAEKLKIK